MNTAIAAIAAISMSIFIIFNTGSMAERLNQTTLSSYAAFSTACYTKVITPSLHNNKLTRTMVRNGYLKPQRVKS
jgi:hypothetical protein